MNEFSFAAALLITKAPFYEKATEDENEGSLFAKTAAKDADSSTRRTASATRA